MSRVLASRENRNDFPKASNDQVENEDLKDSAMGGSSDSWKATSGILSKYKISKGLLFEFDVVDSWDFAKEALEKTKVQTNIKKTPETCFMRIPPMGP